MSSMFSNEMIQCSQLLHVASLFGSSCQRQLHNYLTPKRLGGFLRQWLLTAKLDHRVP